MLKGSGQPIVAIATAAGRGAVGIVRVSGQGLQSLIEAVCGPFVLVPRQATYLPFLDADGGIIDRGLALFFPAPHSYTGEDVVEFQAHGGAVVLQLLVARCLEVGRNMGLRLAEPGEFTQRAYLNDKLDLAQAEAVSDLIDAGTEAAARSAGRSLSGVFSNEIRGLCERMVTLRMLVEATLDFPEEEIDFLQKADAFGKLDGIVAAVDAVLSRTRQGALLREGITVVLAGQPNVGKSSLLNALAGAELAIVTPIAGTTRDKVSQTIQIQGVPLHVVDTAGLRNTGDEVERIGVARSWVEIEQADAVLLLRDMTRLEDETYRIEDANILERLGGVLSDKSRLVHVFNKCDVALPSLVLSGDISHVVLSAQTGEGLEGLRQMLLRLAGWHAQPEGGIFIARTRHVEALQRTRLFLDQAQKHADENFCALDLLAEDLRSAHDALSEITGQFTSDDLLGEIFQRFCIGK
jgi:tRNA modification GTPase